DVDGKPSLLATTVSTHYARPGLSFPGSTVEVRPDRSRHVVHRGDFEVETIAGKHYVRMYSAIVNPESVTPDPNKRGAGTSRYKDIQQDPATGEVTISSGNDTAMLWTGAGRPLRAVQWLAKYEHTDQGKPVHDQHPEYGKGTSQPVLRSFLVPYDAFAKVTAETKLESSPDRVPGTDTVNVDHTGDANQFGIGSTHREDLAAHAKPGSLTTFSSADSYFKSDAAGRKNDIADLYEQLGLPKDFDSTAAGRKNDPWFSWTQDGKTGKWTPNFRNDATELRNIATQLREYVATREQLAQDPQDRKPDARIETDADSFPDSEGNRRPPTTSLDARTARLNDFVNTEGPGKTAVASIAAAVVSPVTTALNDHLSTRTDLPPLDQFHTRRVMGDFRSTLAGGVAQELGKKINQNRSITSLDDLRKAATEGISVNSGPKQSLVEVLGADAVIDRHVADTMTRAELSVLDADSRSKLAESLRNDVTGAVERQLQKLTSVPDPAPKAKRLLADKQLQALQKDIAADLKANATTPFSELKLDEAGLKNAIDNRVMKSVLRKTLDQFTKHDLTTMDSDAVRTIAQNQLPVLDRGLKTEFSKNPALVLVDPKFRQELAAAVTDNAIRVAEQNLPGLTIAPVDPGAVDAFLDKIPDLATQAEIGAVLASDVARIRVDFDTRDTTQTPYDNDFASLRDGAPQRSAEQRQFGEELSAKLNDRNNPPSPAALVKSLAEKFPDLEPKFREIATENRKTPDTRFREEGRATGSPYTFDEHAQMVLGQFQKLTNDDSPESRFMPKDALAKAILFHDIEKSNAKNQFGDGKDGHDREPEHKLGVQTMDRHKDLWRDAREYEAVRAMVDSDPFGFYVRKMHDADTTFAFLDDLAHKIGDSPDQRGTVSPDNLRKFFDEFHQYYQADFSSYTTDASYEADGTTHNGPNAFTKQFKIDEDGKILRTPDGRHFEYSKDDVRARMDALREMFATDENIQHHRERIRAEQEAKIDRELGRTSAPGTDPSTRERGSATDTAPDTDRRTDDSGTSTPGNTAPDTDDLSYVPFVDDDGSVIEVGYKALADKNGNVVGIAFPTRAGDAEFMQASAENRQDSTYRQYPGAVPDRGGKPGDWADVDSPWVGKPFYTDGHAGARGIDVPTLNGVKPLRGDQIARIVDATGLMAKAGATPDTPVVMLQCETATTPNSTGKNDTTTQAAAFAEQMRALGHRGETHAATTKVYTHRTQGWTGVRDGGVFQQFGTRPGDANGSNGKATPPPTDDTSEQRTDTDEILERPPNPAGRDYVQDPVRRAELYATRLSTVLSATPVDMRQVNNALAVLGGDLNQVAVLEREFHAVHGSSIADALNDAVRRRALPSSRVSDVLRALGYENAFFANPNAQPPTPTTAVAPGELDAVMADPNSRTDVQAFTQHLRDLIAGRQSDAALALLGQLGR
ncbi:hypothetical protein, partial [Umezawaea beigongshangensis]|uniref:hypothetical protein n=1 Tax=Umezawaea beigongshangensis TaxID=2780383 RepID=UPI0018F257F2